MLVIAALLGAAFLHSAWHAMVKAGGDGVASLAGMNVVSSGLSLAVLPAVSLPAGRTWAILLLSVLLHNAYKLALAQAYRYGDLSQAYPLARGTSPLFSAVIAAIVLDERLGAWQLGAIALISAGLLSMSLLERRGIVPRPRLLVAASLAGLTVAAYTVVDAWGIRDSGDWMSFTAWLLALDGSTFVCLAVAMKGRTVLSAVAREWPRTLVSGMLGVGAFVTFLWALGRGPAAGVAAVREASVLFACLIGVGVLKEPWSRARAWGAVLITAGISALAALG